MKTFSIAALLGCMVAATNNDIKEFLDTIILDPLPGGRSITNQDEFHQRHELYEEAIQRRNAREAKLGKKNANRGLGKFALWTKEEKKSLTGALIDEADEGGESWSKKRGNSGRGKGRGRGLSEVNALWWQEDVTGAVEDQGPCGTCVPFSSLTALESAHTLKDGQRPSVRYSKQNLAGCTYNNNSDFTTNMYQFTANEASAFMGCNGGSWIQTMFGVLQNHGAMPMEADDEYIGSGFNDEQPCTYSSSLTDAQNEANCSSCKWDVTEAATRKMSSYTKLHGYQIPASPYDVANALKDGPLLVSVSASDPFMDYRSGDPMISLSDECTLDSNNEPILNHLVVLVGFHPGGNATFPSGNRRMLESVNKDELRHLEVDLDDAVRNLAYVQTYEWYQGTLFIQCDIYDSFDDLAQCGSKPGYSGFIFNGSMPACCKMTDTTQVEPEPVVEEEEQPPYSPEDPSSWADYDETNVVAGEAYWIIKNSWGTGWGEDGYIKIEFDPTGAGWCDMHRYAWQFVV